MLVYQTYLYDWHKINIKYFCHMLLSHSFMPFWTKNKTKRINIFLHWHVTSVRHLLSMVAWTWDRDGLMPKPTSGLAVSWLMFFDVILFYSRALEIPTQKLSFGAQKCYTRIPSMIPLFVWEGHKHNII